MYNFLIPICQKQGEVCVKELREKINFDEALEELELDRWEILEKAVAWINFKERIENEPCG